MRAISHWRWRLRYEMRWEVHFEQSILKIVCLLRICQDNASVTSHTFTINDNMLVAWHRQYIFPCIKMRGKIYKLSIMHTIWWCSHYIYIIINRPFLNTWHYYHKTFRYDFRSPSQKSSNQNIIDIMIQCSDWLGFFFWVLLQSLYLKF